MNSGQEATEPGGQKGWIALLLHLHTGYDKTPRSAARHRMEGRKPFGVDRSCLLRVQRLPLGEWSLTGLTLVRGLREAEIQYFRTVLQRGFKPVDRGYKLIDPYRKNG